MRVFQLGWWHVADFSHRLQRSLIKVRRLFIYHLHKHDAERPNVDFRAIRKPCYDFRSHPVRRSNQGLSLRDVARYLCAKPEIGEFNLSEKNIVLMQLQITLRNTCRYLTSVNMVMLRRTLKI